MDHKHTSRLEVAPACPFGHGLLAPTHSQPLFGLHAFIPSSQTALGAGGSWGVGGEGWWWWGRHNIAHTPTHTLPCIDSATHTSNTHIYKNNSEGNADAQCCNVSPTRQEYRRGSAPLGTPVVELESVTPRGTCQCHSHPACLRNQVQPIPRPASFSSRATQTQRKESIFPFHCRTATCRSAGAKLPRVWFYSIMSVSAVDSRAVFSRGSLSDDISGNSSSCATQASDNNRVRLGALRSRL